MESTPIQQRYAFRQAQEPGDPPDGATWINPSGGASGNNVERYSYNRDAGVYELISSVGPDTPTRETVGATWRDTGNAATKVYDGGQWVTLAPSSTQDTYIPHGFVEKYEEERTASTPTPDQVTFQVNSVIDSIRITQTGGSNVSINHVKIDGGSSVVSYGTSPPHTEQLSGPTNADEIELEYGFYDDNTGFIYLEPGRVGAGSHTHTI